MSHSYDESDTQLEDIVAYLDGELSGESYALVERRLASDEDFRQELQSVERAWMALDDLPMTTVDDRFSRTTMSLVIEAATEDLRARTRAIPIIRRRRWLASAAAAAVAVALGFLVFRLAWHDPNHMLVADLPVIDNVDIYSQLKSSQFNEIEFLRLLENELGGQLEELVGDKPELDEREQHFADVSSPRDGEEWLISLDEEERTNLRAKYNRFRELPAPEQNRMREFHRELVESDDARRLERTMLAYQQWLGALPPVRQYELRNIGDPSDRVKRVKQWATRMRDDELLTLTDDELKAFFSELSGPIKNLRREITRDDSDKADDRDRLKLLLSQDFAKWRSELIEQFSVRGPRGTFNRKVIESLPGRSRSRFNNLSPENKVERFLTWMRQHTACRGEISEEELEHFFAEELNPETRAQLLSLPPGAMEQALRRMYKCQPKKGAEGRWTWSPTLNTFVSDTTTPAADSEDNDADDDKTNGRGGRESDNDRRGRDGGGRGGDGRDDGDWNGRRGDGRGPYGGRGYDNWLQGGYDNRPRGFRPPMEFAPGQGGPGQGGPGQGGPGFGGPPFGPHRMNPPQRRAMIEGTPPAEAPPQPQP
jgi:hypothetical protein